MATFTTPCKVTFEASPVEMPISDTETMDVIASVDGDFSPMFGTLNGLEDYLDHKGCPTPFACAVEVWEKVYAD